MKTFLPIFKQRLVDMYIGLWQEDISSRTMLTLYKGVKNIFERSSYIDIITSFKLRNTVARLRLSSHSLNIETGRHLKIPLEDRKCALCTCNEIEDEYHFILICQFFQN